MSGRGHRHALQGAILTEPMPCIYSHAQVRNLSAIDPANPADLQWRFKLRILLTWSITAKPGSKKQTDLFKVSHEK
jgi:hypothetical protein